MPFPGSLVEQPYGLMVTMHRLRAYAGDHALYRRDEENCPAEVKRRVLLTAARSVGKA